MLFCIRLSVTAFPMPRSDFLIVDTQHHKKSPRYIVWAGGTQLTAPYGFHDNREKNSANVPC